MNKAASTFNAVLNTAMVATNAFTSVFEILDKGASMATKSVAKHAEMQKESVRHDMAVFLETKASETIQRLADHQITIDEFRRQSAAHKDYFDQIENKLPDLLAKADAVLSK